MVPPVGAGPARSVPGPSAWGSSDEPVTPGGSTQGPPPGPPAWQTWSPPGTRAATTHGVSTPGGDPEARRRDRGRDGTAAPGGHARSAIIGALVGAIVAGLLVGAALWDRSDVVAVPPTANTVRAQAQPSGDMAGKALDIRGILEKVAPSVVSIHTGSRQGEAAGSGVVIDGSGLILTNAHVIDGASTITVGLVDGQSADAVVVGAVPERDVALIRVSGIENLVPADLGSSSDLQVGDDVVAIGNALNLGDTPSVTTGIVSALSRSLQSPTGALLKDLIQTDAAINPGNSGGPLVNSRGQVVGINTAILQDAQNIGFALSIDSISQTIEDVAAGRSVNVKRPLLGVESLDVAYLDSQVIDRFDISATAGAFVQRITSGSGADEAGLQPGDVITGVDGRPVRNASDLVKRIGELEPGDRIEVEFERSGRSLTVPVTLGEQ